MLEQELIPNLFRSEYAKIVAVLCKTFGLSNIELAEDLVSDTFVTASETWSLKGIPDNPEAWLYTVAKNKTKDHFKRERIYNEKIAPAILHSAAKNEEINIDLSGDNIQDSQLKMIFAVCNPVLSQEAQTALALRILCGFGIDEISKAFLTKKETINKRLLRAKEKLRDFDINFTLTDSKDQKERLNNVLAILYLLFNEGYYSNGISKTIRKDLCYEAMRLLKLLLDDKTTNIPMSNALMALFCFHVSRFEARIDESGEHILYYDQNKDDWNNNLIQQGEKYLQKSAGGNDVSKYHLEAIIAYWHSRKTDTPEKWDNILQLYNRLLQIEYSPIAALNRTYALSIVKGKAKAINEALKIDLKENHLYHSLLAELYKDFEISLQISHLQIAYDLAENNRDKKTIEKKLDIAKNKANESSQ